jgi:hypothetical protein
MEFGQALIMPLFTGENFHSLNRAGTPLMQKNSALLNKKALSFSDSLTAFF